MQSANLLRLGNFNFRSEVLTYLLFCVVLIFWRGFLSFNGNSIISIFVCCRAVIERSANVGGTAYQWRTKMEYDLKPDKFSEARIKPIALGVYRLKGEAIKAAYY